MADWSISKLTVRRILAAVGSLWTGCRVSRDRDRHFSCHAPHNSTPRFVSHFVLAALAINFLVRRNGAWRARSPASCLGVALLGRIISSSRIPLISFMIFF